MSQPNHSESNTPDLSAVFAHIDAHRQIFIDRLVDYVRRPSISAHGVGMGEVAAYLVDLLGDLGLGAVQK